MFKKASLGAAAIAVAASTVVLAVPATSAPRVSPAPYAATANAMVGVAQPLNVFVPKAGSTSVTFTVSSGPAAIVLSISLNSAGFGATSWTPTTSGIWTITGTGAAASVSTQVPVLAAATSISVNTPNQLQFNVESNLTTAYVRALAGSVRPQGSVTLRKYLVGTTGPVLGTGWLQPTSDPLVSVANIPWTPDAYGAYPVFGTYNQQTPAFAPSVSSVQQPEIVGYAPMVSYRFAPALRVGQTSTINAVLGAGIVEGSVGFLFDGVGIRGSVPTVNGVASMTWTPPTEGLHFLRAEFTGNNPGYSNVSTQQIKVLPALVTDQITTTVGATTLSPASPFAMARATSQVVSGVATSGSPVLFSVDGPCVIAGSRLNAIGKGSCTLTATSFGSTTSIGTTVRYPITVGDVAAN